MSNITIPPPEEREAIGKTLDPDEHAGVVVLREGSVFAATAKEGHK